MRKAITILAASVLAMGAAACHKSADTTNVTAEDNMLVPADENSMGGDTTNDMAADENAMTADNGGATADNSSNAM